MMHRQPIQKGFTLVETLVAISIITIVIGTPFYAAVRSINAAENARDELTANMLAQEGVEYVVKVRNDNYIFNYNGSAFSWLHGIDGSGGPNCFSANKCTVNPMTGAGATAFAVCPGGSCTPLYLDPTTGFYTQTNNAAYTKTRFTRSVQLTTISADEVEAVSTVTWSTNHINYTTSAAEYLNNWLSPS